MHTFILWLALFCVSVSQEATKGETARADIQSAIDSLPESGGSVFISAGRYVLDGMIHIKRSHIALHGEPGTVFVLGVNVNQPVLLIGTDVEEPEEEDKIADVKISGIVFDGNKDHQDSEVHSSKTWLRNNTIDVRAVDDLDIDSVNTHNARSGGIVASWGCDRLRIRNSVSHHNYFDGIALYDSHQVLVTGFHCYENGGAGLSLDNELVDVTFADGFIYENRNVGIFARHSDGLNFRNLVIRDNATFGAYLAHATYPPGHEKAGEIMRKTGFHNSNFSNCSFINNGSFGICVESTPDLSSNNCVIGCTFSGNAAPSIRCKTSAVLTSLGNLIYEERFIEANPD